MQNKSFTLIEIVATIAVVGILSLFVIVQNNSAVNAGKDSKRKLDIGILSNAVVLYSNDNYHVKPITDAGLYN